MPLPKISTPTYELEIPSTKKKIRYRPFLVKEEKILIIAMESQSDTEIANAVKDVLSTCILTKGVKVDTLSTFDIEYLFLNIRGKSVGEDVEVLVTCPDDNKTKVPVRINLDDIKIITHDDHKRDIKLDDSLLMRMRYPSINEFIKSNFSTGEVKSEDTFDLIISCIEQIYNDEESWSTSDCTKEEMNDFLDQLNSNQFKEIEKFFDTMPKLSHTLTVNNPNTKVKSDIKLEGLAAFFA
jgi:hypothetical protein|tara:strand:- start:33 stop:749 length:717 start_codon:yes stop_codon:yes gene_type:complete